MRKILLLLVCMLLAIGCDDPNIKRTDFEDQVPIKTTRLKGFNISVIQVEGKKFVVFTSPNGIAAEPLGDSQVEMADDR